MVIPAMSCLIVRSDSVVFTTLSSARTSWWDASRRDNGM
jgi:hypothetical protein